MKSIKENIVNYLPILIIFIFSIVILGKIYDRNVGGWAIGEVLINYEGGFVRRGLLGQIAFIYQDPIFLVTALQKVIVSLFLISLIYLVAVEKSVRLKWLLTLSIVFVSGGLYDFSQANSFEYLDRKEVWFYFSLFLIIILSRTWGFYDTKTMGAISLISTIMILHHEVYVLYVLPIIFLLIMVNKDKLYKNLLIAIFPPVITFILVFINHGDPNISTAIHNSYLNTHGLDIRGGVSSIGWTFYDSFALSLRAAIEGSIAYWIFFFLLSFSMITMLILSKFNKITDLALVFLLNIFLILATAISVVSGWDWGRWVSMYAFFSIYSIYLYEIAVSDVKESWSISLLNSDTVVSKDLKYQIMFTIFITLLLYLAVNTRMNHCCPQNNAIELTVVDNIKNKVFERLKND